MLQKWKKHSTEHCDPACKEKIDCRIEGEGVRGRPIVKWMNRWMSKGERELAGKD